jgi:hypothetical protein
VADYTVLNLKSDVEDSGERFGYAPNMEARFARKELGLEKSGISYFKLASGFRVPFGHEHSEQEESISCSAAARASSSTTRSST